MKFELLAPTVGLVFLAAMLALLEIGRRFGLNQVERHGPDARIGIGVVDSAVYGLFALLVGFTFSRAANRFDQRREIVAREVNAISTAWLRIDLLPPDSQGAIRDGVRAYLDAIIASYANPGTPTRALLEPSAVRRGEEHIWSHVVAATLAPSGESARMLLVPSVNDMFDVVDEERLARRIHPPSIIFVTLGLTALAAALFAGYGVASKSTRNRFFTIGVAVTISIAMLVIVELEYPRLGWIRVSDMDRALAELRATMK